jgi:hypothetical protein
VTQYHQGPPAEPSSKAGSPRRPEDVDTGFWLWLVASALMVVGYVVDLVAVPVGDARVSGGPTALVYAISGVFVVVVAAVVVTFLLLMRQGYRWVRTLLTGGAAATVVYAVSNLLGDERVGLAAVTYAAVTILGSVCIVGGAYLLHRKDAHLFFTR